MDLEGFVWDQRKELDIVKARHIPDMHIHTHYCNHASNQVWIVIKYLKDNLIVGALNEHATPFEEFVQRRGIYLSRDHFTGPENEGRINFFRRCGMTPKGVYDLLDVYSDLQLESGFKDSLPIGLEMDIIPGMESQTDESIQHYKEIFAGYNLPLNHVSGSYHYIDDYSAFRDGFLELMKSKDHESIIWDYFETLGDAAESKRFDFICHPGLVHYAFNRTGILVMDNPTLRSAYLKGYSYLLDAAASSGTALEINTSGIERDEFLHGIPRKRWKDHLLDNPNPHMPISIMKEGIEKGVKFVVGSDWHNNKNLLGLTQAQQYFDQVYDVLVELGAKEVYMIKERNPVPVSLDAFPE